MGRESRQGKGQSSQAARKREFDRLAQRASRERTRQRLAFLEAKVESLEATDRPEHITGLLRQIEELREENTRFRALLSKVLVLTQSFNLSTTGTLAICPGVRPLTWDSIGKAYRSSIPRARKISSCRQNLRKRRIKRGVGWPARRQFAESSGRLLTSILGVFVRFSGS